MLKKAIQRYADALGMAAAMFAAGAGGIQKAIAAEIADQAGSVQESETVRQSETPQESEMQKQPETTQQSETTGQSETLPLKNIKKDFNNFADLHYDFISSSSPSQNARIFWR